MAERTSTPPVIAGRELPPLTQRNIAIALLVAANVGLGLYHVLLILVDPLWASGHDYAIQLEAGRRLLAGDNPYADIGVETWAFRYSPLVAALYAVAEPLGIWFWRLLHVAVLLLLPIRVAVVTAMSWPFGMDMWQANWMTFAAVLGFFALRGNAGAGAGYLALTMLVPRPLMMPLAVWIIWQRRWWLPFAAGLAGYAALVALTGWGDEWVEALVFLGDDLPTSLAPAGWLGSAWYFIAPPVVVALMWRRRFGFAGLAASPYWVVYYFLVLIWEARESQPQFRYRPSGVLLYARARRLWSKVASALVPRLRYHLWVIGRNQPLAGNVPMRNKAAAGDGLPAPGSCIDSRA